MTTAAQKTTITKDNGNRQVPFDPERLIRFVREIGKPFPHLDADSLALQVIASIQGKEKIPAEQITNQLILKSLENMDMENPDWTYIAAHIYLRYLYKQAAKNRAYDAAKKYGSFYGLLKALTSMGVYDQDLLLQYSKEEIDQLEKAIDPEKDKLFTYIGLRTLADRYLAKGYDGEIYELPQERFMVIAMKLMIHEPKERRLERIKEAYWAMSGLLMTVATPTLANAGKSFGQFSSCFIDSVEDSLEGIFNSNTDVARLSKAGGGIGVYLGKIRARHSDIKGFKGKSSGVIPWMKQLNNTAVSVDQLGQRQGAIAVYLDVWHKDILAFLDVKLNNGDERFRTHDLFTGVCIPDLFMEKVRERGDWYLFDPHEVKRVMGFSLEDCYDEEKGKGTFRTRYQQCVEHPGLSKEWIPAIEIFKRIMKSQLETGVPYMFYRDTVNRANPNKHLGMIYCSNLCTEIAQNMSPTVLVSEHMEDKNGDTIVVTKRKVGDFVVCNLSSINLGRAVPHNLLERLIPIQVRMLDNVIDLNEGRIEVLQAVATNRKYRAVGLGTFGWHHLLALKGIRWESIDAVQYADQLYERIAYLTIQTSMELAKEKGAYPGFEGSDWSTGQYFVDRGYVARDEKGRIVPIEGKEEWYQLCQEVMRHGIRNGYLTAVAPNASTSLIAGSTASIDPIFKKFYYEEKRNYKIPVAAPDLNGQTIWYYKSAYEIDPVWSIRQNAARQRHVDQSISFNLYVRNTIKAAELLNIHMTAWEMGLKTTYYTRSTSMDLEECESCAS